MDTFPKKKAVRKSTSPLRLSEPERVILEALAQELGVSLASATRLSILAMARRMKPGRGFDIIL